MAPNWNHPNRPAHRLGSSNATETLLCFYFDFFYFDFSYLNSRPPLSLSTP